MPRETMSDRQAVNLEDAHQFLSQPSRDEESKRSYLEKHTLDLLPTAIDQLATHIGTPELQERTELATLLLEELVKLGSPKELCLALETQLGLATDEVAQCFYSEEDDEAIGDREKDAKKMTEDAPVQKKLEDVHSRLLIVLSTHSQVLGRLKYKKGTAGVIMAQNFTERLDLLLAEMLQALQAGETLSVQHMRSLLSAVAVWCRSVFHWVQGLQTSTEELDALREQVTLMDLLLQYLVLFHSRMSLELLERGFQALFPDAMLARKNAVSLQSAHDGQDLLSCRDALISSLSALGLSPEGHVQWMVGDKRNNPDGRHIYYPIAALILTTWELVEALSRDREAMVQHPVAVAVKGRTDMLTVSLPILGSALNGLAKDAGHIWVWWIAQQMQREGQFADQDEVSMLLELVMPNLAENPSDVARFALHRLVATLLSLVEESQDKVTLYEQLVSSENPFETVRLSCLALLREEISASLRSAKEDSIIHDESFWTVLAPIIFSLPETDPPLQELSLEQALQDSTVPWVLECVKILLLLLSPGSSVETRCKAYVEEAALRSTWIAPLKSALERWQTADATGEPAAVEGSMMLYSLGWTLEQVVTKLESALSGA